MNDEKFWGKDITKADDRKNWLQRLSVRRRILYILCLIFVISWCFFLGFHYAGVLAEKAGFEQFLVTEADYNQSVEEYTTVELSGFKTILLIGCDKRGSNEPSRSDTLMVAFLDLDDKTVNLLSIPRDAYVKIPGHYSTKINHAFSMGGVELTKATVEYLLGIKIDNYAIVDFNGFAEVVDAVGGVEVDVDMRMYNYHEGIDVYPGLQTLSGRDALGYVRYRGTNCSDYQRIAHQQNMIRSLSDKLLSFSSVPKLRQLVNICMDNVETDISFADAFDLAVYAFQMDLDDMGLYTVPGNSMFMEQDGMWLSFEVIDRNRLTSVLNSLTSDDLVFSPNVLDGGGARYTVPEGGEVEENPLVTPPVEEGGSIADSDGDITDIPVPPSDSEVAIPDASGTDLNPGGSAGNSSGAGAGSSPLDNIPVPPDADL